MRGDVAAAVPAATGHEAPVADALGGVVRVVEVGEAEQQVPELVRADADLGVLGDRQVAVDLGVVGVVDRRQGRLVRPDVAAAAGHLGARPGVHDDEGVDVAVAVVVVRLEVDRRVRGDGRVVGQLGRPEGAAALADPVVAVGVPREGLGHLEGADDRAGERDEAVRHLRVVLLHAPVRQDAGREEQVLEVAGRGGHGVVGEADQDDDHPHVAAKRRTVHRGAANDRERRAERELLGRDDDPVVEPEIAWLALQPERFGRDGLAGSRPVQLLVPLRAARGWAGRNRCHCNELRYGVRNTIETTRIRTQVSLPWIGTGRSLPQ